jgi:flagellar L-ring protein precursor FlgH
MKRIIVVLALASTLGGCASMAPERAPAPLPQPIIVEAPRQMNGAIYQAGHDVRMFEDRIARRAGDMVTVVLEEKTQAAKDANTSVSKSTGMGLSVPTLFNHPVPELSASVAHDRDFEGSGSSDQSNKLTGTLTATVIAVYPNGNMVIQGQKQLTLNQGDEYVTITGVIRREDVRPDNTISSTRIANAQLAYTGSGTLDQSNSMGWLARLFNSVLWPF